MLTEEILNSMGKVSGNDSIPKEQFIQALQSQPVLLEAFGKTVVPGMDSLQSSFNELALLDSDLNLKRLMEVRNDRQRTCTNNHIHSIASRGASSS